MIKKMNSISMSMEEMAENWPGMGEDENGLPEETYEAISRHMGRNSAKPAPTAAAPETKKCTKCGQEKPLDAFSRMAKCSAKRRSVCKECTNTYLNAYNAKKHGKKTPETPEVPLNLPADNAEPVVEAEPLRREGVLSRMLAVYTDTQLIQELRNRGYRGHLTAEYEL